MALDRCDDISMSLWFRRRFAFVAASGKTPVSSKKRMDSGCTLYAREQTTADAQPSNYTAAEFRRSLKEDR